MRLLWNGNRAESTNHSRSLSSDCADASTIVPVRGERGEEEEEKKRSRIALLSKRDDHIHVHVQ